MTASYPGYELVGSPQGFFDGSTWSDGDGEQQFDVIDPATERVLVTVAAASVAQADRAIAAAAAAFVSGPWPKMAGIERSLLLHGLADDLERHADEFAKLLVAEIGAPSRLARATHIDSSVELLRWFADAAARGPHPGYEQVLPRQIKPPLAVSLLRQEPAGVVSAMTPYNFPILQLIRKFGGALAAGCTIVAMPSPRAPISTIAFWRLVERSGLPAGVATLVVGGPDVGQRLTTHPAVDMVSFTGSRAVGELVMKQAATSIKKVVLELGGKSPNIILPGTNIEATVPASLLRFSLNAGQACGATTRTFVPQENYSEYVERAQKFFDDLRVGDPTDAETTIGPLIRAEQKTFVSRYVDAALEHGAHIEATATSNEPTGFYFNPVLIGGVTNDAEISQEELFGPVGVVIPFDSVDDALKMAQTTRFGLNANIWGPVADALTVAKVLRSGTVTINGGGAARQDVPWGGYAQSGIGRESGEAGFREFFETKHIQWPV